MSNLDAILFETYFSTSITAERMSLRYSNDQLVALMNSVNVERTNLINKYSKTTLSAIELMKGELQEYLVNIVSLINKEYGEYVPEDRLQKLNDMCNSDAVIVINDNENNHDITADSKNGKVIVNLAKIGKTKENSNPDIFTQIAYAKGSLPHELFHIIIQMLKPEELANERMLINLISGETITSRGMVGFMLNEGFVEKFSKEFCEKYGLYYLIAPQYLPYIDICDYIMVRNPQINSNTIFSLDAAECLGSLSVEEQQKYYQAEAISYAVRHKKRKAEEVQSSKIEKVQIDLGDISEERMVELQQYYNYKNAKLAQMIQQKKSGINL